MYLAISKFNLRDYEAARGDLLNLLKNKQITLKQRSTCYLYMGYICLKYNQFDLAINFCDQV
jgi:hypothetical protein